MAEAKQPGGLYYVRGIAVDSEGKEIKGAPKQPKDTPPEEIARQALSNDPVNRLAGILGQSLTGVNASRAALRGPASVDAEAQDETDSEEEEGLPPLGEMESHLAGVTDVDELKAMRKSDKRKGAKPLYAARLKELQGDGE